MPLILPNTIANAIPADGAKLDQNFDTIVDWANQDAVTADGSTAMRAPLLLPGPPTQANQAATKGYVDSYVPLGVMFMFAGDTEPASWMFCRGQAISRATYAALFAAIGTRFGVGDNVTTFNLPDMRGQYPIGHNAGGTYFSVGVGERFGNKDGVLPSHQHGGVDHLHGFNTGGETAQHNHYGNMGELMRFSGDPIDNVNTFGFRIGDGYTIPLTKVNTYTTATGVENQAHGHGGTTGAADRGLNTTFSGQDPSNGNLPPSVSFNYIMKVQ